MNQAISDPCRRFVNRLPAQQTGSRWQILHGPDGEDRTIRLMEAAKQTSWLNAQEAVSVAKSFDSDIGVRWWQVALASSAPQPQDPIETLFHESKSPHVAFRIAAAELSRAGKAEEAASLLKDALTVDSEFVRHSAMLEIDEAGRDVILQVRDLSSVELSQECVRGLAEHANSQILE